MVRVVMVGAVLMELVIRSRLCGPSWWTTGEGTRSSDVDHRMWIVGAGRIIITF